MMWLLGVTFAWFGFWLLQLAAGCLPKPPRPQRTPGPRVPHWARTDHLPPSPAAAGRPCRKATR